LGAFALTGGSLLAQTTLSVADAPLTILGPAGTSTTFFGQPLASGDLNGDGFEEFITSSSNDGDDLLDRVFIFRGGPDFVSARVATPETIALASAEADVTILAAAENDLTASSVAIGDVNGDTFNDLVIASPGASTAPRVGNGVVHVLYGGADFFDTAVIELAVAGSWDIQIAGAASGSDTGGSGSLFGGFDAQALAVGNLNGDPFGDLIIGAHFGGPVGSAGPNGHVFVVFGEDFPTGTELDLARVGVGGRDVLITGHGDGDVLGEVVLAGDLDGDGLDEVIIPNAFFSNLGFFSSEGRVHIFKGRTSDWPAVVSLTATNADITISGGAVGDELGATAAVGDFNGDGIIDLAAVAMGDVIGSETTEGIAHVYLGGARFAPASAAFTIDSAVADLRVVGRDGGSLGFFPIDAGDANGDDRDDLFLTHRDSSVGGGASQGVTDIVLGQFTFAPSEIRRLDNGDADFALTGEAGDQAASWATGADMDNDGRDEVFVSSSFRNGGEGAVWMFSLPQAPPPATAGVTLH
jgi:hypothetical protein